MSDPAVMPFEVSNSIPGKGTFNAPANAALPVHRATTSASSRSCNDSSFEPDISAISLPTTEGDAP